MIRIDYHAGTHGHFLEFITNVFIMGIDPGGTILWTPGSNSAHNKNPVYKKNRIIVCGHCSQNALGHSDDCVVDKFEPGDRIINIVLDCADDRLYSIARVNALYKGGDGFDSNMQVIPEDVREDRVKLRNQWFSVFNEFEFRTMSYPALDPKPNTDVINFPLGAFFDYYEFCAQLKRIANWLRKPFTPTTDLYSWWANFIERNQGWNSYIKCCKILEDILANKDSPIECTAIEEGFINYNILRVTNRHHGAIFDSNNYPENAQDIYKEL